MYRDSAPLLLFVVAISLAGCGEDSTAESESEAAAAAAEQTPEPDRRAIAGARAEMIATALRGYLLDHGLSRIPANFDLQALVDEGRLQAEDIVDPWDNPFVLIIPGQVNPDFDVVSWGADGQPGGSGEDEDIAR